MTAKKQTIPNLKKTNLGLIQYIGISVIIVGMLFFLASIFRIWKADWHYAQGKALINANEYADGITHLQNSILISPDEALFYDELSDAYAKLAVAYVGSDATMSAELVEAAEITSDYTQQLNDRHLNFYKTRARVYITLAQLDPAFLNEAKTTLSTALTYSPNDAKIMYNLALIESSLDETNTARTRLEKAVEIKPNYAAARFELGKLYEVNEEPDKAKEQYLYILDELQIPSVETQERLEYLEAFEASASGETEVSKMN